MKVGYKWYDAENKTLLFPFGFGLSYTTYRYSGLQVTPGDKVKVTFTVANAGAAKARKLRKSTLHCRPPHKSRPNAWSVSRRSS